MKKLILIVCWISLLSPAFAADSFENRQRHATLQRTFEDSTGFFVIEYEYNPQYASVPMVGGADNKLHYSARVTVYEVVDGKKTQMGRTLSGTYVPGGCFEDIPSEWVRRARENR